MSEPKAARIVYQTREEWLAARRAWIGGSDCPAILGLSPWATADDIAAQKRGDAPDVEETERMLWGRLLEPAIAAEWAKQTGRSIVPESYQEFLLPDQDGRIAVYKNREHTRLGCTPDRRVRCTERGDGLLQIKTTGERHAKDWKDGPPVHVQAQGQHELLVTGLQWISYAVLIGGNKLLWFDSERHERFQAAMLKAELEFARRVWGDG